MKIYRHSVYKQTNKKLNKIMFKKKDKITTMITKDANGGSES